MHLTYQNNLFVLQCQFSERKKVKKAGFYFDKKLKKWVTTSLITALKFKEFADDFTLKIFEYEIADSFQETSVLDFPAPDGLEYRPYQKACIEFFSKRKSHILIADQPGLGKTIESIGICNAEKALKILVVTKASLRINWYRELSKWLINSEISVGIALSKTFPDTDIIVTSYNLLKRYAPVWMYTHWDFLICDEAHCLKNPESGRAKRVFGYEHKNDDKCVDPISCDFFISLTGTPIPNRPYEMWNIIQKCDPDGLGKNRINFIKRYCAGYQEKTYGNKYRWNTDGASNLEELQHRMRQSFMIRRTKSDVLPELPDKTYNIIELPSAGLVRKETALEKNIKILMGGLDEDLDTMAEKIVHSGQNLQEQLENIKNTKPEEFTRISTARKDLALAKVPMIKEHVEDLMQSGDKYVVFVYHRDVAKQLKEHFTDAAFVIGGISPKKQQKEIDRFENDPDCTLLIGNIDSIGEGHTFIASSHVVMAEVSWVPIHFEQAPDRVHRYGQTKAVNVDILVVENSLECYMVRKVLQKIKNINKALDR